MRRGRKNYCKRGEQSSMSINLPTPSVRSIPPEIQKRQSYKPRWRLLVIIGLVLIAIWLLVSGIVTWKLTHRRILVFAEPAPQWPGVDVQSVRLSAVDG